MLPKLSRLPGYHFLIGSSVQEAMWMRKVSREGAIRRRARGQATSQDDDTSATRSRLRLGNNGDDEELDGTIHLSGPVNRTIRSVMSRVLS
jgi:hypothetical protein